MTQPTVDGAGPRRAETARARSSAGTEGRRAEVSSLAMRIPVDLAERSGLDAQRLLDGLGLATDELRVRGRRFAWNDYVTVIERLAEAVGGDARLETLGEAIPEVLPELRALASAFVSPGALYRFILEVIDPASYPMVRFEVKAAPSDVLEVEAVLREGYRECPAFFYGTSGALRTMSRYLGLPDAKVSATVTGRSGAWRVELPESQTVASRLRRRAHVLSRRVFLRAAMREMEADKTELLVRLREIGEAAVALERKNAELEREVESRRRTERALQHALRTGSCAAFLVDDGRVQPANDLGAFALRNDGAALERRLVTAVEGGPDPELEVTPLSREGGVLVMRTGVGDLIEQRLELAVRDWGLTRRQRDVLRGLVNGLGNKEIAREISCTVKTVEAHVTALLERADADSRLSVVASFWADL